MTTLLHGDITNRILNGFWDVAAQLGVGFLETNYVRALGYAFDDRKLFYRREVPLLVEYRGREVGLYRADFLVEEKVIVEVKAVIRDEAMHEAQAMAQLRASTVEVALILYFGRKPSFKRLVWTMDRRVGITGAGIP